MLTFSPIDRERTFSHTGERYWPSIPDEVIQDDYLVLYGNARDPVGNSAVVLNIQTPITYYKANAEKPRVVRWNREAFLISPRLADTPTPVSNLE